MAKIMQDTLTFFSIYMSNIDQYYPEAEELLKRGAFNVARSFIPGKKMSC